MSTFLWVAAVLAGLIIVGYVWLRIAVVRRAHRCTRELLARCTPVLRAIEAGESPLPLDAIERLAADPATRNILRLGLRELRREGLFPERYGTPAAHAESDLVVWLRHPNELGVSPDEMELMATVERQGATPDSPWTYYVFRFRTHAPHWAAADGWMAGVSGPYLGARGTPGVGPSGTFSTFEAWGVKPPTEHVEFSHQLALRYS